MIKDNYDSYKKNQDISLIKVLNFFSRNRLIIGSISIISTLTASIVVSQIKPKYEGSTQLIIKKERFFNDQENLRLQISTPESTFTRQKSSIIIFDSPEVLSAPFEKAKADFISRGIDVSEVTLDKWQNNFETYFLPKTNILQIDYRDSNKSSIILNLNNISKAYQDFSKKNAKKNLNDAKIFLQTKKDIYSARSKSSLEKLEKFLNYKSRKSIKKDKNSKERNPLFSKNIENELEYDLRKKASQDIENLEAIENKILDLRSEDITKYFSWEIINKPKINGKIWPQTKELIFLSIFFSSVLTTLIVYLKEYLAGILYDYGDINYHLNINFISRIYCLDREINRIILDKNFSNSTKFNQIEDNLGIITFIDKDYDEFIFEEISSKGKYKFLNSINELKEVKNLILIIQEGKISLNDIDKIKRLINLYEIKFLGWFLLDTKNKFI